MGLTQEAAAELAGISRSYWGLVENRLRAPDHIREEMAAVVGLDPEVMDDLWEPRP